MGSLGEPLRGSDTITIRIRIKSESKTWIGITSLNGSGFDFHASAHGEIEPCVLSFVKSYFVTVLKEFKGTERTQKQGTTERRTRFLVQPA